MTNGWSSEPPSEVGLFHFTYTCKGCRPHEEMVLVEDRGGVFWGRLGGDWQPVTYWHAGYTEPRWKRQRKLARKKQLAQLAEIEREYKHFVAGEEAHDFHDQRINEILLKAESRAKQKHGWEKIENFTPMDALLAKESSETNEAYEMRLDGMKSTLGYLFEEGCHPGVLIRRILGMAKSIRPDLILWMSMEEMGGLMNEERATISARLKRIYTGYLAAAGMKGTRSHCQKTATHSEKLRQAAKGNKNRVKNLKKAA